MEIMGLSFNQRTKSIVSVALLVCFVIFNIANQSTKIEPTLRRELSTDSSFTYRYLSKNLGDGRCEWTPPEFLKTLNREKTTTVIASYPGSGKRLVWRIIEAMTGTSFMTDEFKHLLICIIGNIDVYFQTFIFS